MEFVLIGKIINTHGINGELKIESYTDFFNERFKEDTLVYIGENHLEFKIKKARLHKGFVLLLLHNNENINLVEKYKNMYIYKDLNDIKPLNKGEYYFRDLKNLDVYQNNQLVGKVIRVEEGNKYNFLRIKKDDKEILVPYLNNFVLNVDLDKQRIDVVDMEGLL